VRSVTAWKLLGYCEIGAVEARWARVARQAGCGWSAPKSPAHQVAG
jgi:hypothetical protein